MRKRKTAVDQVAAVPETPAAFRLICNMVLNPDVHPRHRSELVQASSKALQAKYSRDDQSLLIAAGHELLNLHQRRCDLYIQSTNNGRLAPADQEEYDNLVQRECDLVKSLECPTGYDDEDASEDRKRRADFREKQAPLTDAEKDEMALCFARSKIHDYRRSQTPEGLASSRISELFLKSFRPGLSSDEREELRKLKEQFPGPAREDNDTVKFLTAFLKKRAEQRDQERRERS
jgi:hypothetical protein